MPNETLILAVYGRVWSRSGSSLVEFLHCERELHPPKGTRAKKTKSEFGKMLQAVQLLGSLRGRHLRHTQLWGRSMFQGFLEILRERNPIKDWIFCHNAQRDTSYCF